MGGLTFSLRFATIKVHAKNRSRHQLFLVAGGFFSLSFRFHLGKIGGKKWKKEKEFPL